jgi:hypothetical protein
MDSNSQDNQQQDSKASAVFEKVCGDARVTFRPGVWDQRRGLIIISNGDDVMLDTSDVLTLIDGLGAYLEDQRKGAKATR